MKLNRETAASVLRTALATIPLDATEDERVELTILHKARLLRLLLKEHTGSMATTIFVGALHIAGEIG